MKVRVPEGCHAVSHAGQTIEITDDGSVEVEKDALRVLVSHGFVPWEECQRTSNLAGLPRDQLVAHSMNIVINTIETISDEDIHARLATVKTAILPVEQDASNGNATVSAIGIEDVSVLS